MFHRDPERQPSVLHKKPSMKHQKSSATPVQPYEVVDGVNGGQYFGHAIPSPGPGPSRAMSTEPQMNGNSFGAHGSQSKLEREDSNTSNSTPRSAKKSHRMSNFPWFGSRRRKGSTSSASAPDGQGAHAQPKLDISDEDVENNDDLELAEHEYPYAYDGAHGYYDTNSYYYPGQTAYSNDALQDNRNAASGPPSAAQNQFQNYNQGHVTSSTSNNHMSGGNGNNNNGNGNGNGNGNYQTQSSNGSSRRRQSIGHASPLNEIQEDEYEYYGVAPAKPYQGMQQGIGGFAPQRQTSSQIPHYAQGQGQVEGVTSPSPAQTMTSNPYSSDNPLTRSVMRQQMQKKEWMAQQEQQQLSQFIPDPTQEPMRRQSVPRTASGNEASQPPLPLPLPQLNREHSYNNHQHQRQQEEEEDIPRAMSPEQDEDLNLARTKSVPNVSVNPLGQHPLLREQAITIPSPLSATPDHVGTPQPPGLPPKEPLSRGGSANPQNKSTASTSKIPPIPGSATAINTNNNTNANNGSRRNSLGKAPGNLPQFPQQQYAHQRFLRDQGGTGKALSPYTPQSMYTMSSTPDIPQRDGRRSMDNHAGEVDPMGMWQHQQPQRSQTQQHDYAQDGIQDGAYKQGSQHQEQPQRHSYEQNSSQAHNYNQPQQQRHSYEEYQPHSHSHPHPQPQNYGWGPAQHVEQYDNQHKTHNEQQDRKPYLEHQPRSFLQQKDQYDPLMQDAWPQQRELYEVQQERAKEQQQHYEAQRILGLKSPVDARLESPNLFVVNPDKSRAQAPGDVGIANLEPQKAQQHQPINERGSQWPLTPLAVPIVSEAVVSPLKPKSDWDRSCMEYFMRKYRERLNGKNWEKEPFRDIMGCPLYPSDSHHTTLSQLIGTTTASIASPSSAENTTLDDILPHLLNDRLFYLAYAITGTSKLTYSHLLWELFGSNPGHLLTIYAALASTNGPSNASEPMDLDQYLCAAIEGSKTSTVTGRAAERAEQVSMEGLLNMVTRRLDEPGTSSYDFVLRQIKWQLRVLQGELQAKFGAESRWRTRIPVSFDRSLTGPDSTASQNLPLYHGLQQYLASQEHIIQKAMLHTCAQLPDLSALLGPNPSPVTHLEEAEKAANRGREPPPVPRKLSPYQKEPEPEPEPPATVTLLLDGPGSGKTRMMRDKLLSATKGSGMYFYAPNLPPVEQVTTANNIMTQHHTPQKQGKNKMTLGESTRPYAATRDTYSLYQDLSYLERSGIGGGRPVLGIADLRYNRLVSTESALEPLFRGRGLLLEMLEKLEAAAGGRVSVRERTTTWTQLQMANMAMAAGHGGLDVIDLAYRFARLHHGSLASSSSSSAEQDVTAGGNPTKTNKPAVLVIDEAQFAVGDPLAERIIRGMLEQTQPGGHAYVVGSRMLQVDQKPFSSLERELSFSGSSNLQLHHLQELGMKPMRRGKKRDSVIERTPCSWAQVDNSETFWSVLVHHAWSLVGEIFELRAQGFLGVGGGLGQATAGDGTAGGGNGGGMGGDDRRLDEHRRMSIGSRTHSQDQILGKRQSQTSLRAATMTPLTNKGDATNKSSLTQSKEGRRSRQLRDIPLLTREGQALSFDINLPGTSFTSWTEVETTLQQSWNVLSGTERDYAIDKESSRFFGRVRWTATFAEELLRASSMTAGRHVTFQTYDSGYGSQQAVDGDVNGQNTAESVPASNSNRGGGLSKDGVRAAAQRAAGRIKTALKERMDGIRGTRCADELIWAALEIDVFGSSKSFEGPLAADLVAAGFALVENTETPPHATRHDDAHVVAEDSLPGQGTQNQAVSRGASGPVRARLAEPLVVEAIMEYLYESPIQVLDGYLRRFFTPLQTDHADRECLWKIAEDVLAKKLQNTIRYTNDTISQHRRTGFFDILRNSRSPTPIHKLRRRSTLQYDSSNPNQHHHQQFSHHDYWTYGEAERFIGSLERYYLQDSGTNIDRPGEWRVEDWLYETEEEHRPNFFFFDGGDGYGEDLDDDGALGCLFFLTDRENVRRKILVVLQFAPAPATEITTEENSSDSDNRTNDNINLGDSHNASPPPDAFPTGTPPNYRRSRTPPPANNQPPPPPSSSHSHSHSYTHSSQSHPKPTAASTFHEYSTSPFPTLSNLITSLWATSLSPPGQPPQTPWPVFYIYVPPPSTEIVDDAFVAELSRSVKDKMPRNHYVGYVDISNSDGIWGTTFPAWIGQMADEKRKGVKRMRRERRRERVGRMGRR